MNLYFATGTLLCLVTTCLSAAGQIVTFTNQPARPHDVADQTIQCDLDASRTIRQHNQVVDDSKQQLRRHQHRTITILDTHQGTAARARVTYSLSTTKVMAGEKQIIEAKQPIEGNTYLVTRQGEELIITAESGEPISEEEDKILRVQLGTFGKPNPLSQFLHGKRIAVGESIDVPDEVAAELLGLTGNRGKTDQLALKLTGVKQIQRKQHAVFETLLRSHSDESTLTLLMKGELIIEPSTCRTQSINLHGPVAISERRGPMQGRFTVSTNGSLTVAVTNDHRSDTSTTASRNLFRKRK